MICGESLDVKNILIPSGELDTRLMVGILENDGEIVGGLVYIDNRPNDNSVDRVFVCVKSNKGYLTIINAKFEEHLEDQTRIMLMSNVDPERKVAKAHMKNGYKILKKHPLDVLVNEPKSIAMVRYARSPLPTAAELNDIETIHARAREMRDKIAEDSKGRADRRTAMNARGGHRKRPKTVRRHRRYSRTKRFIV